jgi:hypothetical protein
VSAPVAVRLSAPVPRFTSAIVSLRFETLTCSAPPAPLITIAVASQSRVFGAASATHPVGAVSEVGEIWMFCSPVAGPVAPPLIVTLSLAPSVTATDAGVAPSVLTCTAACAGAASAKRPRIPITRMVPRGMRRA